MGSLPGSHPSNSPCGSLAPACAHKSLPFTSSDCRKGSSFSPRSWSTLIFQQWAHALPLHPCHQGILSSTMSISGLDNALVASQLLNDTGSPVMSLPAGRLTTLASLAHRPTASTCPSFAPPCHRGIPSSSLIQCRPRSHNYGSLKDKNIGQTRKSLLLTSTTSSSRQLRLESGKLIGGGANCTKVLSIISSFKF